MKNLNLLRNSQNILVNDTQKLARGLNLNQTVLRKHKMELDDLHTSLTRLKARLSAINEEYIYLNEVALLTYSCMLIICWTGLLNVKKFCVLI